jgi:hypothetical protein
MLAENARLLTLETQAQAALRPITRPQRNVAGQVRPRTQVAPTMSTSFWDVIIRIFNPPVARGLGAAFAIIVAASAYILLGGERGAQYATVKGRAVLRETRSGFFGWQWYVSKQVGDQAITLHRGDELTAEVTTTVQLGDNRSVAHLYPGGRLVVRADGKGVNLEHGVIENDIHHAPGEIPDYLVDAGKVQAVDKGTRFLVTRDGDDVALRTDEGRVTLVWDTVQVDVVTGEQIRYEGSRLSLVELQTPVVRLDSAKEGQALTNRSSITITARIFPGASLVALDSTKLQEIGRFVADSDGHVVGVLNLGGEGQYGYRFYVDATVPNPRKSVQSEPVTLTVDRTAPTVSLSRTIQSGDEIVIRGQTEATAQVTANNVNVTVQPDGSFEARIPSAANLKLIALIVTDEAGNARPIEVTVP